jgi:1-deoxy-D-xylulose-5-phosphate reductoisomerase
MKKKIAILGSTGSIGKTSLNIFKKNLKEFNIILLSANSNYLSINSQIKKYKPKYFIINNVNVFNKIKNRYKKKKIKIYNKFSDLPRKKIKFDITISAIVGIAGLEPTIKFISLSKKILLANKETIICAWHIIDKLCKKNNSKIIPIDSEHFSIDQLTKDYKNEDIKKIYITASGGPFLKKSLKDFKNIKPKEAIKHPNWQMGKKISIDSSNMMNKVLEVIEAFKLFPFDPDKYKIIIHPQSLIHAIVFFKNGQTKFLYHETDMLIPIANAIYENKIDIETLSGKKNSFPKNCHSLKFQEIDKKKFPIITLLSKNIFKNSGPIILNASNEVLVDSFIKGKITFNSIYLYLRAVFRDKDFGKYAIKKTPNIKEIYRIDKWARRKTLEKINEKKNI